MRRTWLLGLLTEHADGGRGVVDNGHRNTFLYDEGPQRRGPQLAMEAAH